MVDRILIIDDDERLAAMLGSYLASRGFAVEQRADGRSGLAALEAGDMSAVILDVMLPDMDGFEICRRIRAKSDVPVLMLTARDAVEARVQGLDAGADDYLTKPFDFRELLARLRALTRRERRPLAPERIEIGALAIDVPGRHVFRRGREIPLTSREYALLEYLARHAGEVVGRADIAEHVWDEHYDAFSNVVDVYVQRLRRKLDTPGAPSIIRTRRGQGYQLI
jgi:two-component system copper resistance phosphate regulon response regulator CusR